MNEYAARRGRAKHEPHANADQLQRAGDGGGRRAREAELPCGQLPILRGDGRSGGGLLARQEIWKEREKKGEDQNEAALDDADDLDKPWPEA